MGANLKLNTSSHSIAAFGILLVLKLVKNCKIKILNMIKTHYYSDRLYEGGHVLGCDDLKNTLQKNTLQKNTLQKNTLQTHYKKHTTNKQYCTILT